MHTYLIIIIKSFVYLSCYGTSNLLEISMLYRIVNPGYNKYKVGRLSLIITI